MVPPAKFKAYVTMLPRLSAEEQMVAANMTVAATGRSLKDPDYQRFMRSLEAQQQGLTRERAVKPTRQQLSEIGIRVVREEMPSDKPVRARRATPSRARRRPSHSH